MSHLRNFGMGFNAMLETDRSAAYAVQGGYDDFSRGNLYQTEREIRVEHSPAQPGDEPPSPSATSAPIAIPRAGTYTPSYHGSPLDPTPTPTPVLPGR
ncbi:hypothetical protein RHS01_06201 [Rhizoctonia solani]|uniref:Uncharacterized protein n=1 Tax=Rhizoctonia solani TaxID=456999 RepID=A0A8H7ID54_9AGAM|nr:hypothetical protein RHS01_06201 [Rhizoctonia solani]